ncbi:MAG: TusE/DsrC/DsvC family sulfur relay protein [Anaerolineae bacterium]
MSAQLELPDGRVLALDEDAYLLDWRHWSPAVAETMAAADGLDLQPEHWQVLDILRAYYQEYEIAPPMRALIRILKQRTGDDRFASRQLYRLFPQGPAKQACRYAGLPRPVSCI